MDDYPGSRDAQPPAPRSADHREHRRDDRTGHHPLHPLPPVGRTFLAGFESTYHPDTGVDCAEVTDHVRRRDADLDQVLSTGVRHLRYPLRWQRIQPTPEAFDWTETDRVLHGLRDRGAVPVVDLVHHTTYPDWLPGGFADPGFGPAYVRYVESVALRYPWLDAYTLFNEPFATLFLAGHEALWPPYGRGTAGFRSLLLNVLPALSHAAARWRELLPAAHHVWIDTGEHHVGTGRGAAHAAMANDRRHVVLDLVLGHDLDPDRPFLGPLLADGGEALAGLSPVQVDVLGIDYYPHSEWFYDDDAGHAPSPAPVGLAAVAQTYWERYQVPLMVTETNIRGLPSDRSSWLRYTLQEYETALARGVPLHGYCWFPQVDSADWDSLLARCAGRADPVGVLSLGSDGTRARTSFTDVWEAAARGAPVASLPAIRFQQPNADVLAGYLPALSRWPWRDPAPGEVVPPVVTDLPALPSLPLETPMPPTPLSIADPPVEPDLVVLSHLRWTWVWQRPQHLVSRLARHRSRAGARTWFVEEPTPADVPEPVLQTEQVDGVTRAVLMVPRTAVAKVRRSDGTLGWPDRLDFEHPAARSYGDLLHEAVRTPGTVADPDVWLYTPMAIELAERLAPGRVVYDVMDDLASFSKAPQGLVLRQRRLIADADLVLTGGPSLHQSVLRQRQHGVHLFRSGVETAHYAESRRLRRPHDRRVAGYVGVIDERLDLDLLRELAEMLPDWTIRVVGPVAKIEEASLPRAENIEYTGMRCYEDLPEVMAGFDVALMPFALNEATRSISPTKTLEYLAAGLPVVSTRVPDVVADYSEVVALADDAPGFARACRRVVLHDASARDRRVRPLQERQEWDHIAASIIELLTSADEDTGTLAARGESA